MTVLFEFSCFMTQWVVGLNASSPEIRPSFIHLIIQSFLLVFISHNVLDIYLRQGRYVIVVIYLTVSLSVCLSVCVSVCLSVSLSVCLLATFRKSSRTDLHEIFRKSWQWAGEQMIKFCWRYGSRIRIRIWIRIATLVRRGLADICIVPVLLVSYKNVLRLAS